MKINSFYLLFLTLCFFKKSVNSQTAFELSKMNVLYAGIENPVSIACVEDFDSLHLDEAEIKLVTDSEKENVNSSNKKYLINPRLVNEGKTKKYFLLYKDGKVISKSEVRIKRIPDPVGALGSYENGYSVPRAVLRVESRLIARKPPGFDLNVNYSVTKWSLTIVNSDKALSASGSGGTLSADAIKYLGLRLAKDITARFSNKEQWQISK